MYLATVAGLTLIPSLSKLAVNPRRSPERVGNAHLADQFAGFPVHGLSPCARPPAPVEPKALTVPLDHGCRLHRYHGPEATRPHPVEPYPQHPIDGVPAQTAAPLTIQHRYLMTQRDELKRQFCAAAKPASQPRQGRRNQWEHAGDITESRPKSPAFSLLSEFQQEQPAKRAGTICRRSHPRPLTRRNSHEPELRYLTWMNGSFPGLRVISSTRL